MWTASPGQVSQCEGRIDVRKGGRGVGENLFPEQLDDPQKTSSLGGVVTL